MTKKSIYEVNEYFIDINKIVTLSISGHWSSRALYVNGQEICIGSDEEYEEQARVLMRDFRGLDEVEND